MINVVCQSSLACSSLPPSDRRLLSELNLPRENFLHMTSPEFDAQQMAANSNGENME